MKLRRLGLLIAGVAITVIGSCGDENIAETHDAVAQFKEDVALINSYLEANNYEADTTNSGVRVVVLEEGQGKAPEVRDIIVFDYFARRLERSESGVLLDTAYFDTTDSIFAKSKNIFNSARKYEPLVRTYTIDGFGLTLDGGFIPGFTQGVTKLMGLLREGGNGEIILPSITAYGNNPRSPFGNTVLIFKISLVRIE